jgi:glycosyltransferase involved in cell wall biosynthesis
MTAKPRVLLVSIVPPKNDCGVRILMHRMLVERSPFELHVASNADFADDALVHTPLRLPYFIDRVRKSRFGPRLTAWISDYENFVWPLTTNSALEAAVESFKPHVVLTLAECGFSHVARKTAQQHGLPLVGLFLDWFPVMKRHYGHASTQRILSRRFRELYAACDLAFCISDGMQEVLGPHPNSHVIYPIPGRHRVPEKPWPPSTGKFRLVYVGSVQNFYGRMLCSLIQKLEETKDLEIVVVGPTADWPQPILERAEIDGIYLGFKPPDESAGVIATADALLVVMSFESEQELFTRTSFTTKFVDYAAFGRPVILWAPDYCTPVRVVRENGGAVVVNDDDPETVVSVCRRIAEDSAWRKQLSDEAARLHKTLFNPERLQAIFVDEIEKLIGNRAGGLANCARLSWTRLEY